MVPSRGVQIDGHLAEDKGRASLGPGMRSGTGASCARRYRERHLAAGGHRSEEECAVGVGRGARLADGWRSRPSVGQARFVGW